MTKRNVVVTHARREERGASMKKARVATLWLDGCSGCHMSLLDIDEAIIAVAQRADIVYGPLVDAQEFPDDVDVAIVEGAVSSQDDLEKIKRVRERSRILVALGDCAVTSNVPSMRNRLPMKTILERVYIEGADVQKGIPTEGVPTLLRHAVPLARRGQGRPSRARLPAAGRRDPVRSQRAAGRPHSRPGKQSAIWLRKPPCEPSSSTRSPASKATPRSPSASTRTARWSIRRSTSRRFAGSRSSPKAGRSTKCRRSPRASAASARSAICSPR